MIDYKLLAKAQEYYENLKYLYVNLPWEVPYEYVEITLPNGTSPSMLLGKSDECLIGSAEQAFIHYIDKYDIQTPDLKLMSITPCFREEKVVNEYTKPYFMKLELCIVNPSDKNCQILDVMNNARTFFKERLGLKIEMEEIYDKDNDILSYDLHALIKDKKLELGSYGYRRYYGLRWIYGTGLAEPRTSLACLEN